jgi:phage I-like protein
MKYRTIELIPLTNTKPPEKGNVVNVVGVVGEWKGHEAGAFKISQADLQRLAENFNALKRDVVVDYEHQTLTGGEAPAAGWIKSLTANGDKLEANIEWTSKAKEMIEKNEYKYLSPVYAFSSTDPKTGAPIGVTLHSVALTNSPFLAELGEVKANKQGEKDMDKEQLEAENKKLKEQQAAQAEANAKLKLELANAEVNNAIACKKITEKQKEWALKYAQSDLEGFKAYINATEAQEAKKLPENNIFANKKTSKEQTDDDFIVAAAVKL